MFHPTLHELLQFHDFAHAVPLSGISSSTHLLGKHLFILQEKLIGSLSEVFHLLSHLLPFEQLSIKQLQHHMITTSCHICLPSV